MPWGQACSQDLEKGGGAFLKEWDNCKRLWPEFSLLSNQIQTVCQKLRRIFRPKTGDLQKKDLHQNWVGLFGRNRKFKRFFRPKTGGLQKKGLHRNWDGFFGRFQTLLPPKSRQLPHNFVTKSLWGGAVFIFWAKIGLKTTKNVRFCILLPPPPPTYATAWGSECKDSSRWTIFVIFQTKIAMFIPFRTHFEPFLSN